MYLYVQKIEGKYQFGVKMLRYVKAIIVYDATLR